MDAVLLSSIFRHADLCCGPRNNNNISTTVFMVLSSCMVYLSNADSAPGGHQPSNLPSPSIWAVHLPFIITSRHAALRRDGLYQPTRPSTPLSHVHGVTLRCDFNLPAATRAPIRPPAAGLHPSSVRACRLRPALACPTAHVSHATGCRFTIRLLYID